MSGPLVEVRGLRVYAFHGVRDFERERGQTFVIDVWLSCAPSAAEARDDLADAVNYWRCATVWPSWPRGCRTTCSSGLRP